MLKNGTILNERYEIISTVGSGGMSDVYKAKCHKLNRYVAIKVLKKEYSMDKNFVIKFRGEAQSAAGLMNPNIVNIYDVCEENDLHYIVMELIEGITLKAYIEKKGRLDIKETISIAIQIAQGIKAAHAHHIIHRDIKPQNIIISKDGKVKVTDFGIARVSSAQTINSNALGSVHYISPEQARGGYVDERSDIYSLGITMYEMLTGEVPFQSDTAVSVALMHIQNELPSPRNIVNDIPVSIEKIIYKCTQKRVDRRYSDAGELIDDLKEALLTVNSTDLSSPLVAPTVNVNDKSATSGANNKPNKQPQPSSDTKPINTKSIAKKQQAKDVDKNKHRKKDFIEKLASDDKRKNPIIERSITILCVIIALVIIVLVGYGISLIKNTLTPPDIFVPIENQTTSYDSQLGVSNVVMPDLVNSKSSDAIIELNKLNLKNHLSYDYSSTIEKGCVISQQYQEGVELERNTQVELVVSLGPLEYEIEDFAGMTIDEVEALLADYKLVFSPQFIYDDEIEMGKAIRTVPVKGTVVKAGATVAVYISRGSQYDVTTVPSITGLTVEEARIALEDAGLSLGEVNYANSNNFAKDKIATQSYQADAVVSCGSKIDVTVSLGPAAPMASLTLQKSNFARFISEYNNTFHTPTGPGSSMSVPYTYGVVTLNLTLKDENGVTTSTDIYSNTITPDQLPLQITDIIGKPGIYDGTIKVYLTLGDIRYTVGSFYVEFK